MAAWACRWAAAFAVQRGSWRQWRVPDMQQLAAAHSCCSTSSTAAKHAPLCCVLRLAPVPLCRLLLQFWLWGSMTQAEKAMEASPVFKLPGITAAIQKELDWTSFVVDIMTNLHDDKVG